MSNSRAWQAFVDRFLLWYDDCDALPDVVNNHRLKQLAKQARTLQRQDNTMGASIKRAIEHYRIDK